MNKYIFPLILLFFLQPTLYGCVENDCEHEFENALASFLEGSLIKKDTEVSEKAKKELGSLLGKCDFPDRGIEIYMMGVYRKHHLAILASEKKLLESLIESKNILDDGDINSLHLAAAHSTTDILELLIDFGYVVDSRDEHGGTPLMAAVGLNNISNISFLIEKGANVNLVAKSGWSALSLAVVDDNFEAAQLLLAKGASICLKDSEGRTLLDIARKGSREDLLPLLERENQKQSCK